jgi:UDP-glucose 4-epimerase
MVVPRFVQWAMNGEPIQVYGDGNQQRCFGNVFDVIDAINRLMETPDAVGQVFNIGATDEISVMGLAQRVKAITGSQSEIVCVPYEQAYDIGFEDMRRRIPDVAKIKAYTGWQPTTPLDETIRQMIAYYESRRG